MSSVSDDKGLRFIYKNNEANYKKNNSFGIH